jgi:hypothetical protein
MPWRYGAVQMTKAEEQQVKNYLAGKYYAVLYGELAPSNRVFVERQILERGEGGKVTWPSSTGDDIRRSLLSTALAMAQRASVNPADTRKLFLTLVERNKL